MHAGPAQESRRSAGGKAEVAWGLARRVVRHKIVLVKVRRLGALCYGQALVLLLQAACISGMAASLRKPLILRGSIL